MITTSIPLLKSDAPPLLFDSHETERLTMAIVDSAQDRQK